MASTRIKCFDIIRYLKNHHIKSGVFSAIKKYDILVFQKTFTEKHRRLAEKLKLQGKKIVLDLNVNYFYKKGETQQVNKFQINNLQSFLPLADKVLVSSQFLKEIAQQYHSDVHYIPEHISTIGPHSPKKISNPVRLVYCGYAIKADCVLLIADILRDLSRKVDLELLFICEKDPGLKLPIKTSFIKYDQNNLVNILRQGDIKVAPRKLNNSYDPGHSFTKIGYPMSVGLPVVASPVPSYLGTPALIASNNDEWFNHILSLINNPTEYNELSQKGISFVKNNFSLDKIGKMYMNFFNKLLHV